MRNQMTLTEMKEIVLSFLSLLWGTIFLLPGEILGVASRIDLLSTYAGDIFWGILLVSSSLFLLLSSRSRYALFRRATHAFLWLFWMAIATLVIYRSSFNGFTVTDILLGSPYVAIAFIHAAFYARLVYVK